MVNRMDSQPRRVPLLGEERPAAGTRQQGTCVNGDVLPANPRQGGCSKMQPGVWSNPLILTTGAKSIPAKQPWRQASSRSGPLRAEELSDSFREFRKHQ